MNAVCNPTSSPGTAELPQPSVSLKRRPRLEGHFQNAVLSHHVCCHLEAVALVGLWPIIYRGLNPLRIATGKCTRRRSLLY